MSESTVLLEHHLKALKLPTMLRDYAKTATRCARKNVDHAGYLLQLTEQELIERPPENDGRPSATSRPRSSPPSKRSMASTSRLSGGSPRSTTRWWWS